MPSTLRIALDTLQKQVVSEFEMELRIRQVIDLARMTPFHALGNLGNAALLAWLFWDKLPHIAILSWLSVFAVFTGLEMPRWWRKRHWPIPKQVSRRAIQRATGWSLLAGLLWATAATYAFPHGDSLLQLSILFLVGGLAAGSIATMTAQPVACAAFALPPLSSVIIMLATDHDDVFQAMSIMALLYVVVLGSALFGGFSSFATIVRNRVDSRAMENRLLAMELAAAEEANRAKSLFLAKMSHELRTPLNAIIGFSEIIRGESSHGTTVREYAGDIHEAGEHLLRIVNDVLDISRVEAGKLQLDESDISIPDVIEASLRLVRATAASRGVTLAIDVPATLPLLRADENRVRQILINLVTNAVKFSKPEGHTTIGAALNGNGELVVYVSDDGIGMSPEQVEMVREPFRQVENSLSRQHGGAGLGLALVDGFIQLHNGRMEIDSTLGAGTRVTVIFPPERVLRPHRH